MAEYIDRDGLINDLKDLPEQERIEYMGIYDCIKSTTAADVVEVKHGKWKRTDDGAAYCTNCKRKMNPHCYGYAYCSLCGARMDGDTE